MCLWNGVGSLSKGQDERGTTEDKESLTGLRRRLPASDSQSLGVGLQAPEKKWFPTFYFKTDRSLFK